jgi:hypothetical protein
VIVRTNGVRCLLELRSIRLKRDFGEIIEPNASEKAIDFEMKVTVSDLDVAMMAHVS